MTRDMRKNFGMYACVGDDVIAWEWYDTDSDTARRDEFNDIQHDYIHTKHYRYVGWSDDFYGLGVMVLSKIRIGKSDTHL